LNSDSTPLVSVIIPTFNHANLLGKALESVINQTYGNWEAIVVDNQSTDETNQVIGKFKNSRIQYLKISNGGIIAKSRNLGINVAKGEWIAFLDSDDWWTKDKLEICLKNVDEKIDFIYHKLEIIYDNANSYFKTKKNIGRQLNKPILEDLLISEIKNGNAIGNSSVVVRKDILDKIGGISENKKMVASEDFNTWLRIAQITDKFKYIQNKLGYYLVHDKSAQKRDLSIPHREAVSEFIELFDEKQKLNLEVKLKYMSGNYNILNKNYSKAKKDFLFVYKNSGINLKLRSLLKTILIIFK
jgi:glycosyltransferase involved in cell wall biosynthesis